MAALVIFLTCLVSPDAGARSVSQIRDAKVLRWGGDLQGGEPYVYRDPHDSDKLVGFEVDIADALARELGVRAEFIQTDWSTLVLALERDTFDIILNGLEDTAARREQLLLSAPYYRFAARLMARKNDASIGHSLDALAGIRVGTLNGSLGFELLRSRATPVVYEGCAEPYLDLVQGRIDAVLLDDIIATRYGAPHPELRVVSDLAEGTYAIGFQKDALELRDAVNAALAKLTRAGALEAILRKHGLWNERQTKLTEAIPHAQTSPSLGNQFGYFMQAAGMTLAVSSAAMAMALVLGLALAMLATYGPRGARRAVGIYVEVYRGTPVLLQLFVLYFGLAPLIRLDAMSAAILGLGMNYAAYEAEVYRAAFKAVPAGQMQAAEALGMRWSLAMRRIILPQTFRVALPNVTNDFIALLKDSSLVSAITVVELTKQMTIAAVDMRSWIVPGALTALLYLAMSYPLGLLSRRLERRLEGA